MVIFVTAYDSYAIQAFDAHAIDYLLKPFSDQRFESAITGAEVPMSRGYRVEVESWLRQPL